MFTFYSQDDSLYRNLRYFPVTEGTVVTASGKMQRMKTLI